MLKYAAFFMFIPFCIPAQEARAQMPPEIVAHCAEKWGVDYEMRLYCQNKQYEAYKKLVYQDASPTVKAVLDVVPLENFSRNSYCMAGERYEDKLWECGAGLKTETGKLNAVFKSARSKLSDAGRAELLSKQRTWLKSRDAKCKVAEWLGEQTPIVTSDVIDCLEAETIARTRQLSHMG